MSKIFSKSIFLIILTLFLFLTFFPKQKVQAETDNEYYKATVLEILSEEVSTITGEETTTQNLKLEITSGDRKKDEIEVSVPNINPNNENEKYQIKDKVILLKEKDNENNPFTIIDRDRNMSLLIITGIFILVLVIITGFKGIGSILGLIFSFLILIQYILPQILAGQNAILVTLIGSIFIITISLFLAHGFRKQTVITLISTIITLIISLGISYFFVNFTKLFGFGSEEAFYVSLGVEQIDMKGLLLSAIIIGTLGILDDVTASQTEIIFELKEANQNYIFRDLFAHSMQIGKQHITSMVNTLVLAYAAASLSIFILLIKDSQPFWVITSNELLAEEIVRTITGSLALVLAVPISSAIASWYQGKEK